MIGASNLRQQKRLWTVLERPDMIKRTNDERDADHAREEALLEQIMLTRTAAEWEEYLQARHVPACARAHDGRGGGRSADCLRAACCIVSMTGRRAWMVRSRVPVAAFKFAHDGPRIDTPPPTLGAAYRGRCCGECGYRCRRTSRGSARRG